MKSISFYLTLTSVALLVSSSLTFADTVYISSNGSSSIEKIINGQVTQFISDSPYLYGPTGMALDSSGNLYVANNGLPNQANVAEFSPTGVFIKDVATGLNNLRGLVFDSAGNLFTSNLNTNIITEIPAGGGAPFTIAGSSDGLNGPNGLSFDAAGNLYVANSWSNSVDKITFSGSTATVTPFITSGLTGVTGVTAITSGALAGDFLVVDKNSSSVLAYNSAGDLIAGNPFIYDPNLSDGPKYIAMASDGNFFVTDANDDQVTEYDSSGKFVQTFSTDIEGGKAFIGACAVLTQADLPVPEPSTYVLLLAAAGALYFKLRRPKAVLVPSILS